MLARWPWRRSNPHQLRWTSRWPRVMSLEWTKTSLQCATAGLMLHTWLQEPSFQSGKQPETSGRLWKLESETDLYLSKSYLETKTTRKSKESSTTQPSPNQQPPRSLRSNNPQSWQRLTVLTMNSLINQSCWNNLYQWCQKIIKKKNMKSLINVSFFETAPPNDAVLSPWNDRISLQSFENALPSMPLRGRQKAWGKKTAAASVGKIQPCKCGYKMITDKNWGWTLDNTNEQSEFTSKYVYLIVEKWRSTKN